MVRGGDQRIAQSGIDGAVKGDLIVDIGTVERGAGQFRQTPACRGGLIGKRGAGRICFGLDVEALHQRKGLLVHRIVITRHRIRKSANSTEEHTSELQSLMSSSYD